MVDSRDGEGNTWLQHIMVSESKKVLKKMTEACQKDIGAHFKELLVAKSGTIWATKWIRIAMDYNPTVKYPCVHTGINRLIKKKGHFFLTVEFQLIICGRNNGNTNHH